MSTHYDIACVTCRVEAGVEFDAECRDKEALEHVVQNKKVFAALSALSYAYVYLGGGRIEADWLNEHVDHELRVLSCYEAVDELTPR